MDMPENPLAVVGHNNPPAPTPYEAAKHRIESLYDEAKLWLDGAVVNDQPTAESIGALLNLLREAEKQADAARIAENKPFDDGKAEVQARYAELIGNTKTGKGKTVKAIEACKAALVPWLQKQEEARQAEAAKLRAEAIEKERLAQEALRKADRSNLEESEAAEQAVADAKKASAIAGKVEKSSTSIGNVAGRAISMRTYYIATLADPIQFGKYAWENHRDEYLEFMQALAKRLVDGGKRDLPGVMITEDKRAA